MYLLEVGRRDGLVQLVTLGSDSEAFCLVLSAREDLD